MFLRLQIELKVAVKKKAIKMLMFSHVSSVTYGALSLKGDTTLMCILHFRI